MIVTKVDSSNARLILQSLKMPNYVETPLKGFGEFSIETMCNTLPNKSISWIVTSVNGYSHYHLQKQL